MLVRLRWLLGVAALGAVGVAMAQIPDPSAMEVLTKIDPPETEIAREALEQARRSADIADKAFWVAVLAAVLSAGVLGIEWRRYMTEGVRLGLTVIPDGEMFGGVKDDKTYLVLQVANRGTMSTSLEYMVLRYYPNWLSCRFRRVLPHIVRVSQFIPNVAGLRGLRRKVLLKWDHRLKPKVFLVRNPGAPLPTLLEPGRTWMGWATHTPEFDQFIASGRLYAGVEGTHGRVMKRVRRWSPPDESEPV